MGVEIMDDSDKSLASFQEALTGIQLVARHSRAVAKSIIDERDAPPSMEDVAKQGTFASVELLPVAGQPEVKKVALSLEGETAAIMARPINKIIARALKNTSRGGSSSTDRLVTGEGTDRDLERASGELEEFARAMQTPLTQTKITDAQRIALELERATACKVAMRFDVSGSNLDIRFVEVTTHANAGPVEKAVTPPGGALAGFLGRAFKRRTEPVAPVSRNGAFTNAVMSGQRTGVTFVPVTKNGGEWFTSGMHKQKNGLDIKFSSTPEGQASFFQAASIVLGRQINPPQAGLPLGGGGVLRWHGNDGTDLG